jgi:hypothetical protein
MFENSKDLATAALRLLERTRTETDERMWADLEIAAGILAVHVHDWLIIRERARPDVTGEDQNSFRAEFPAWEVLRQIANGIKHPRSKYPNISDGTAREPEWKDSGFWNAPQRATLFVPDKNGNEQSVHSLTFQFCMEYLGAPSHRSPKRAAS